MNTVLQRPVSTSLETRSWKQIPKLLGTTEANGGLSVPLVAACQWRVATRTYCSSASKLNDFLLYPRYGIALLVVA